MLRAIQNRNIKGTLCGASCGDKRVTNSAFA